MNKKHKSAIERQLELLDQMLSPSKQSMDEAVEFANEHSRLYEGEDFAERWTRAYDDYLDEGGML